MKTNYKNLILTLLLTLAITFRLSPVRPAQAVRPGDEGIIQPAPPTDAKGSLVVEMPPGSASLREYSLVGVPMGGGATPVPTEEPTEEATPRPPTDTYLEPPVVIAAQPPEKEFFVIKTRNDKIFYLIIDHSKMSDNVYLVTEVDEEDLLNFVQVNDSPSLLPFLQPSKPTPTSLPSPEPQEPETITQPTFSIPINSGMAIAGAMFLLLAGGTLFYWKVIKAKDQSPNEGDFFEDDFLEKSANDDIDDENE